MVVGLASAGDPGPAEARAFDLRHLPPAYFSRPHPYLAALRAWDPLHRNADGSILITRHDDVKRVWKDLTAVVDKREIFTRRFGEGPLLEHHTSTMLFRDPPEHGRLRAIVTPFFKPEAIARLRPAVEAHVADLLSAVRARGEIDFVRDFAYPLTTFVICRMLGLPPEDGAMVGAWGRRIAMPLNPDADKATIDSGHAAARELKDYLLDRLNAARGSDRLDPQANVLSALVAAEREGARISEVEMQHMLILMLNGGHESTSNLLSVAMKGLVDDPARMAELRDPDMPISAAMEELVRFVSPLQLQGRRLTQPVSLSAGELPAGTEIVISVASANWDESVFEEPERIRFDRRPNPHVGFGAGVHICIGKPLAKMEASIALPAFVRAFRAIEQTGEAPFRASPRFRSLLSLPLQVA